MKRQRDEENAIVPGGESERRIAGVTTVVPQKKNKSVVESKEDGKEETGGSSMKKEAVKWWEECWPWMNGLADEQMWWGYVWSPFWDFDFVDKAYNPHQLGDVVWDDDIWNVK